MEKIKVCFAADSSMDMTGGAQSLRSLMRLLQNYGVEPVLVGHKNSEQIEIAKKDGIKTKVIPGKVFSYPMHKFVVSSFLKYPFKRLFNYRARQKMKAFIRDEKFDIVHLNSMLSCVEWAAAASECGVPYVWHVREYMGQDHNRYLRGKRYYARYMKKAKAILAISKDVQKFWSEKLGRKCVLVYNGLETDKLMCDTESRFTKDEVCCVIAGRVAEGKRQMDAVKAVESLIKKGYTGLNLKIVGYRDADPYEIGVRDYIKENGLGDNISLIGFTDKVTEELETCDIGLVCSTREAFGRVTIEYMLAGLLTIGSNSGGTPELIRDKDTGLLYEVGDIEQLAAHIEWAINNREDAKNMISRSQKYAADTFSIDNTARKVYSVYESIISRSR